METISRIAEVPVFIPSKKLQVLNGFAKAVGDDRAAKARSSWGRPIQPASRRISPSSYCYYLRANLSPSMASCNNDG
jgi:hypothetical protein